LLACAKTRSRCQKLLPFLSLITVTFHHSLN